MGLGRAQASALGYPDLPIAVVPHPFGGRSREDVRETARNCVTEIARLVCESDSKTSAAARTHATPAARAELISAPGNIEKFNRFFLERRWTDGLPVIPPTAGRVARMLRHTDRAPDDIVALIAPAYGAATIERIAVNAVLAGCYPEYLPVLIAATEAIGAKEFHLQSIQATTNPAAVWLVINGPIAARLQVNSGGSCLGPGAWANATLGRALRLILQNIGGALPGEMDRATHGQAAKYTLCCAENEAANPWEPLHVERGFAADSSTVTVVGALGTWSMCIEARNDIELLRVIASTMVYPGGSDYVYGGTPWIVLSPEHAAILKHGGLSKAEVKRRLWEQAKLPLNLPAASDLRRTQNARRSELGEIGPDSLVPISVRPDDITIIVAGGAGAHSIYVPISGHTKSVTREIR